MIPALFDGERITPQQPLGWYSLMPDLFPDCFPVERNGRWGVADLEGRVLLPFLYDDVHLNSCADGKTGWPRCEADCSCALRDGRVTLLDRNLHPVWEDLTALPERCRGYLLVRRGRKFGAAAQDGRPISEVSMLKREAMSLIRRLNGEHPS